MQQKLWQPCLMALTGWSLLTHPLMGEESQPAEQVAAQPMTEGELLQQLDDKDKATYKSLSPDGKALVLKMASLTNDPLMQKCKSVLGVINNMRDMLKQFENQIQNSQKKPDKEN